MAKADKKKGAAKAPDDLPRVSAHPRARRQVAEIKSWAGLGGFLLVLLLSKDAGTPWFDAVGRGIVGGMALYLAAWAIAVTVWRQLVRAELVVARQRVEERRREAAEAAEAAKAAA